MLEKIDIDDREGLRAWLETQPREIADWVAIRSGLRVLPIFWYWALYDQSVRSKLGLEISFEAHLLRTLRAALLSHLYLTWNEKLTSVKDQGLKIGSIDPKFNSVLMAHDTVALGYGLIDKQQHATTASSALIAYASALNQATFEFSKSLPIQLTGDIDPNYIRLEWLYDLTANQSDISRHSVKLWQKTNAIYPIWEMIRKNIEDEIERDGASNWSFWNKWYEDALEGHPQNWQMLEQIALIDPEIWEAGVGGVAKRIDEIEHEFADATEFSETNLTPEQALAKNSKVVLLQLDVLKLFVEEEIQTLRVPNDISKEVMARIVLLEGILASVTAIQLAVNDNNLPRQNALTIVEEQLPKVIEAADELADKLGSTEVSETIILMGATIEHLTKRGTPGYMATGIAATEVVLSTIKKWFERCKSPKKKGG